MTVHTTPDPDAFRQNLRGKRHYVFNGSKPMPSATSIKPPKVFWTRTPLGTSVPLDVLRAAEWVLDNRGRLDQTIDPDMIIEEISISPEIALRRAGDRGTHVHDAIAAHVLGQEPFDLTDEETGFYQAALAFIGDYDVEFIAVEIVVVITDLGIAGTVDWVGHAAGKTVIGDWKTRSGRHGAYPEEVGQLGMYSLADHMVVGAPPGRQIPMPVIDGLAVVSLTVDGSYALYPIDLDGARSTARHMHLSFDHAQQLDCTGKQAIGSPVVAAPIFNTLEDELQLSLRIQWLRSRLKALTPAARLEASRTWPGDTPRKAAEICSDVEVDAIVACLDRVEAAHGIPFGQTDPAAPEVTKGLLTSK